MGVPDTPPAGRRPMAKPWPTPVMEAARRRACQLPYRRAVHLRDLKRGSWRQGLPAVGPLFCPAVGPLLYPCLPVPD